MKNIRLFVVCAVWCSLLAACGGSSSSNPAPANAFKVESKSEVVGTTGGSVTQTLADGTVFKLDVPAGALTSSTTLSLTTQQPVEGQRFNLLLQPAGLVLANGTAATLTITLPPGQELPTTGGLIYNSVPIPFTRLSDGRIQVSLSSFAGSTAATGKLSALGKILFAPTPAPTAPCAGAAGAASLNSNGGLTANQTITVQAYGACMQGAINNMLANEQFLEAMMAALSMKQYKSVLGTAISTDPIVALAKTALCTGYSRALDRARTTSVSNMGEVNSLVETILIWENLAIIYSDIGNFTICPGIGATDSQTVIAAKVTEAKTVYNQAKPTITSTSSSQYASARTEANQTAQTKREVQALLAVSPAPTVQTTLNTEIIQRAQPGLLDAMLQAPWNLCRDRIDYSELMNLMLTLDSPDAVKNAAQYCGTVLNAQTKNMTTGGTVIATLATPLGGVSASETRASGSIKAAKNAKLTISGPIQALQCPFGGAISNESLTIKVDGTTVQKQATPPFLVNALEIDLATILELAHPGATAALTSATLSIERTGTSCADFWGVNPAPLLSLTLNLGSAKILFDAFSNPLGDLYSVSPDGSGLTKLGHGVTPSYIQWLSNYTKIAFRGTSNNGVFTYWSINPDGSGLTQIQLPLRVDDTNPTWSPDGRRVAFYQNNSTFNNPICIWNTDGSGQNCFQPDGLGFWGDDGPSWSPDGTRITFSFISVDPTTAGQNIYVMNVDGSGVVKLTNYHYPNSFPQASYPAWSPDGSKIALSISNNNDSYGLKGSNIFVMNTDGTGLVQLTTDNLSQGPVWSPDGTQIAYMYGLGYGFSRNYIRVMKADGTGQIQVAQGWHPSWR
ncbi:MAG: TolB family protein [Desulfuromonadaceae bacterium]